MNKIKFLNFPRTHNQSNTFIAYLSFIYGEEQLFVELKDKLKFSDYFGMNWNAVSDCLRDFHWIKEKGIIIVHNEMPILDESVMKIYLDVLIDAINDWKKDEEHYLEVIFPEGSRKIIENILRK